MAKFVLTTCAACLARQKPVSTRAKPGLHEDDQDGADHDPEQVELLAEGRRSRWTGPGGTGDGKPGGPRRHEERRGPQHPFFRWF